MPAERLAAIRRWVEDGRDYGTATARDLLAEVDRLRARIAEARSALVARRKLLEDARRIVDAIHLREPIPRGGFVITLEGAHMGDVSRVQFDLRKELEEIEEPAIVREVSP